MENDSYEQGIDNSFEFKDGDQQSVHEYYTTSPTRQAPGSQKKDIKHPFKGGSNTYIFIYKLLPLLEVGIAISF